MSLITRLTDLTVRVGTEFKTVKTKLSGNSAGDITGLTTSVKTSLLAAINSLVTDKQSLSQKGVANGYAGLDSGGRVPMAQLPAIIDKNKGFFATSAALTSAFPSASDGDYAIVGATDTVWSWDNGTGGWVDGDTKGAVTSVAGKTGAVTLVKADVGLSSVDNTADTAKPVSTAQQTALNAKEGTIAAGTTSNFWRGDKTWQDLFTQVRAATLTGLSVATNAVISASDTVLGALGKIQAQITAHSGSGGSAHAVATTGAHGFMSSTDKSKLDGVAASANNYSHPAGDGSLHVPVTGTTNNTKVLKAGSTAGSAAWGTVTFSELASKPTTISGFGITDAYSKTEIGNPETDFVATFDAAL